MERGILTTSSPSLSLSSVDVFSIWNTDNELDEAAGSLC